MQKIVSAMQSTMQQKNNNSNHESKITRGSVIIKYFNSLLHIKNKELEAKDDKVAQLEAMLSETQTKLEEVKEVIRYSNIIITESLERINATLRP